MELEEPFMSTPVNPNNFPAKLWRLVNNPHYQSICWNAAGDGVIIDQQLFESELFSPSRGLYETNELFKTTNFTSFIRQLNLYGFKKLMPGSGTTVGLHHPGGNLVVGDGGNHQFYNEHFRKGRPDLLVNLKRLTSTNKAKMAAGLDVSSRPPNRFQKLLTGSLTEDNKGGCQGLMPAEQIHRTNRRDSISPYPSVNPPSHNHTALPGIQLNCTPVPPRTWSSLFSLHQRQLASHSSFPEKGIFYPVLQRFPADMTYTMQSTATSVHVQQGPPAMQRYSSYMQHAAQYPQAYYPTAIFPCCTTPVHLPHLNGCSSPAVSPCQHYSYFQSSPMHPTFPMEFFNTRWSSNDSEELRKDEMNLESAFKFADELQSSSQLEMVKLDAVESLAEPVATVATSPGNDEAHCSQINQLESLPPVNAEALLGDQAVRCESPLASAYDYLLNSNHTEVDMNTSSDADITLCVDEVDFLPSDVTSSPTHIPTDEYEDNTDLNLLVEVACKPEQYAKKKE